MPILNKQLGNSFPYNASYCDKVKVKCCTCNTVQINHMYYDMEDTPYKNDFFIECANSQCKNTEEGNGRLQNFILIEFIERIVH